MATVVPGFHRRGTISVSGVRQAIETPVARADIRSWPLDPTIAHLIVLDVRMVPTPEQVEGWLNAAYRPSRDAPRPLTLRTGALYPAAAAAFTAAGFEVADRLALLERPLREAMPRRRATASAPASLRRARRRDLEALAAIDQSAFAPGWRNDARSLGAIADATPRSLRRLATIQGVAQRRPIGFAITGMANATGYIQRLAVHPHGQRLGIGAQLVDDALGWLTRRGARRALVNTGVDNAAAIELYEAASFEMLDQQLVVLEHRRTS